MPKFPACTGAPAYGAPMQAAYSYPAVDETTGLTTELPSSEPETAQISYTIAAGHLPTVTGANIPYRIFPFVWFRAQNTSGSARTASWRLEKNGSSIATGTSGSIANYSYCHGSLQYQMPDPYPAVGDVISVKLWASGAGTYLQNKAFMVGPYRHAHGSAKMPVVWQGYGGANSFATEANYPAPSWGTGTYRTLPRYVFTIADAVYAIISTYTSANVPYISYAHPTYGLVRPDCDYYAASGSGYMSASANASAAYISMRRITLLTFLPLNIKI